jgi:hypothetical protein
VADARSHNGRVPSWGSYSYAFGPLVATAVLIGLVVVLRWAFGRGQSVVAAPARPGPPTDYGVLVPVAAPASPQEAQRMQRHLNARAIPCTVARTNDGLRVLVWPDQETAARSVLRPYA